ALQQVVEPRRLLFRCGDNHLAAAVGWNALLLAVCVQLALSLHAQLRLERARRVVDARVQHPAVVAGLVAADAPLLVEDAQAQLRIADEQLAGDRQADNARTDHDDVVAAHEIKVAGLRDVIPSLREISPGLMSSRAKRGISPEL